MPAHAHIKLHDQFVALIGMKLHAHNQIYTSTNFLDIKALRTPLGMPGLAWSHLLKLTKSVCNNNIYDAACTTSNNAATILTDSILNIYKTLPEKTIKPNTSLPFDIQLLIKQKRKIKRAFIKTRNPFLKTVLNATSKKIKQQIKIHRTTDIQNRIQSLQLNNDPKSWRTLKKEMGYPSKGS